MAAAPGTAARQGRSTGRVFALVDCKCFYCSCERVFDPALEGVAVAVLSNNDGCVVARSDEVKAAGVRMGDPYFQCRGRLEAAGARVFSSNYALYADMSRRVMSVLRRFASVQEVYSIDEAFHLLPRLGHDVLPDVAHEMRETVHRCTGIPIHVGIGATKTLAKVADELARAHGGVFVFPQADDARDRVLSAFPVEDVWGVGPARAAKLHGLGVTTALDLARLAALVLAGDYITDDAIVFNQVRRVRITSTPGMWFNVDGELRTNEPVEFEAVPGALHVVVGPDYVAAAPASGDAP